MRNRLASTLALMGVLFLLPSGVARAQQFETGVYYLGPRVWLGNLNGAVAIGGQIERGFTEPGRYGPGIISGGVGIDWYSWSYDYNILGNAYSYDYTVVPVQIFGHYHFVIEKNRKLDPYAGLAFVYSHVSASSSGPGFGSYSASGSTSDIAGDVGVRYFMSPKFSVYGQLGFGYGTLGLGASWKI